LNFGGRLAISGLLQEINITRRDVEDTIKENREECMLMKGGGDFSRRKGRAKEEQKVAVKIWDNQELEEDRRLDKARFEEQEVEKMAVELKEVIDKATTKKEILNSQGSKRNRKEK
jgi:hypothetical protein